MNFRRIPFQFSTTDPVKRQAELQKRFGLPAKQDNMYVDLTNPGAMGIGNTTASSPRLQHRVPIFVEGSSEPVKPSVDSQNNVDVGRKPRVRVVPIEIEGVDSTSKRHRNLSGPAPEVEGKPHQNGFWPPWSSVSSLKRPVPPSKTTSEPKVCNIPINIEKDNTNENVMSPVSVQPDKSTSPPTEGSQNSVSESPQKSTPFPKETSHKPNGCNVSKSSNPVSEKNSPEQVSMKKIENILKKFKEYQFEVEKLLEINNEKQYRYLDEMLTRCMLQLDDIDTMGNVTVRLSRKAAVKQVQAAIDLLESKVSKVVSQLEVTKDELSEVVSIGENPEDCKGVEMKEEDNVATSASEVCDKKLDVGDVPNMQCDLPGIELSNQISAEESGYTNTFECIDKMSVANSQSATITEVVADVEHSAEMDSEPVFEERTEEKVCIGLCNSSVCEAEIKPPLVFNEVQEVNNITDCAEEASNKSAGIESKDASAMSAPIPKYGTELPADNETNVQNTSTSLTPVNNLENCINDTQSCI